VWAKAILLTQEESPIEEITGRLTGGSVNVDGNSAVRRTTSFSMILDKDDKEFSDFQWMLESKFKLYVGLNNTINPTYPDIIWIP
jgi:hypothetical protein